MKNVLVLTISGIILVCALSMTAFAASKARAEFCEEEYEQVQDAFEILVKPHLDPVLADKVLNSSWLQE